MFALTLAMRCLFFCLLLSLRSFASSVAKLRYVLLVLVVAAWSADVWCCVLLVPGVATLRLFASAGVCFCCCVALEVPFATVFCCLLVGGALAAAFGFCCCLLLVLGTAGGVCWRCLLVVLGAVGDVCW